MGILLYTHRERKEMAQQELIIGQSDNVDKWKQVESTI
jgi:hypothetical protein